MNTSVVRVLLVAGALLGLTAIARLAAWPLVSVSLAAPSDSGVVLASPTGTRRVVAESVAMIVGRDPFRIGRLPAITAYDPVRLAQPIAPPPPRPVLTLVGVLNGSEASAVVEGLPGVEGSRVLRVGDSVAGLLVKQIGTNRVVIVGMDTTWVLEVREPWKN